MKGMDWRGWYEKRYPEVVASGYDGIVYGSRESLMAAAFHGKSNKPDFHYRFKSVESLEKYAAEYIEGRKARAEALAERKAKRAAYVHDYKVGDILYSSWGWEQTNIDFYEVVGVAGKSIKIRKRNGKAVDPPGGGGGYSSMSGFLVVGEGYDGDKVLTKMVLPGGSVKLTSYSWASKWEGRPMYCSWYA